jgi:hypothetical protein
MQFHCVSIDDDDDDRGREGKLSKVSTVPDSFVVLVDQCGRHAVFSD